MRRNGGRFFDAEAASWAAHLPFFLHAVSVLRYAMSKSAVRGSAERSPLTSDTHCSVAVMASRNAAIADGYDASSTASTHDSATASFRRRKGLDVVRPTRRLPIGEDWRFALTSMLVSKR